MKSFCQVFSTICDLCSAGQFLKNEIFTIIFHEMSFGRRESRGTIHEKHGVFKRFSKMWFGGEESRGDGGLAGERRHPPQSRLPQTCLLALSLDALSFLQTSLLVHPRLPSSVLLIPFSTPSPHSLASPSSFFSTLLPHPSHLSALVALVLVPPRPHYPGPALVVPLASPLHPLLPSSPRVARALTLPSLNPFCPQVLQILLPCTFCRVPLPPLPSPLLIGFHRLLLFIKKHHHHHQHPNRH